MASKARGAHHDASAVVVRHIPRNAPLIKLQIWSLKALCVGRTEVDNVFLKGSDTEQMGC
jgi:hypothetical protein